MAKRTVVSDISKAVYDFETAEKIYFATEWGDEEGLDYNMISGDDAEHSAAESGIVLGAKKLSPETYYIFRPSKDGSKMIPLHVSYKKKTIENLEKGSYKFGSAAIMREALCL